MNAIQSKLWKSEDKTMSNETPTLALLNETDNPKRFGGQMDSDDGQGNQLWSFPAIGKVANRFEDEDGGIWWDDDIEGWNYTDEYALD